MCTPYTKYNDSSTSPFRKTFTISTYLTHNNQLNSFQPKDIEHQLCYQSLRTPSSTPSRYLTPTHICALTAHCITTTMPPTSGNPSRPSSLAPSSQSTINLTCSSLKPVTYDNTPYCMLATTPPHSNGTHSHLHIFPYHTQLTSITFINPNPNPNPSHSNLHAHAPCTAIKVTHL